MKAIVFRTVAEVRGEEESCSGRQQGTGLPACAVFRIGLHVLEGEPALGLPGSKDIPATIAALPGSPGGKRERVTHVRLKARHADC